MTEELNLGKEPKKFERRSSMKKVHLLISILMAAVLCLAGTSWAGEASVFDDYQKVIIRAYTTSSAPYSVFLEVRDTTGVFLDSEDVSVTGQSQTPNPSIAGIPLPPLQSGPPYSAIYTIAIDASSSDISISLDSESGVLYLFYTNSAVHTMQYKIVLLLPINGACGSSSGAGPFTTTPPNLCSSGNATTPVNSGSGQWTWSCQGINGGTNVTNCSATAPVNGTCGSSSGAGPFTTTPPNLCSSGNAAVVVNNGSGQWTWSCQGINGGTTVTNCSATAPVNGTCGSSSGAGPFTTTPPNLCSSGNAAVVVNNGSGQWTWSCQGINGGTNVTNCSATAPVNGTCGSSSGAGPFTTTPPNLCSSGNPTAAVNNGSGQWTWSCQGINGGTTVTNCSATAPVNGACGSANGGTFTSAPTTNLCSKGTATSVPSGSGPWSWTCAGLNGGSTSPTCTASASQTGHSVDLAITYISAPTGVYYGATWAASITIANRGSNTSGAFELKYYQGSAASGTLLGTTTVDGLAAGAYTSVSITPRLYIPAHVWSYVTVVAVPNALDTDTNTSNNSAIRSVTGN
jgi:hypothetical protein